MVDIATEGFDLVPERAAQAFESMSGLQVSVHVIEAFWGNCFAPERISHRGKGLCHLAKLRGHELSCLRFEIDHLRPYLLGHPEGCVKLCHAALLECAVPVMHSGRISAVLFAGLMRPKRNMAVDLIDDRQTGALKRLPAKQQRPKTVSQDEAQLYLEGLRQLAARLQAWVVERSRIIDEDVVESKLPRGMRREAIEKFISSRYRDDISLADLANTLHLSRSRTAHAVKEVCGRNFGELLQNYRLRRAAGSLWLTECSVAEAAAQCGFGDLSNFHKSFRKRYGMTPLEYRKQQKAMNRPVYEVT